MYSDKVEDALNRQSKNNGKTSITAKLREASFFLRQAIMEADVNTLPDNVTIEDINKVEVDVPEVVKEFLQNVISGPDYRRKTETKRSRIDSIGQDLIFAATAGRKKPKKHLQLGLAMKSLTGSRRVIESLNRMGHCVNYHDVAELETEMTFEASNNSTYTPVGMDLIRCVGTGLAWDNYDRFVETSSGKDTIHDTVGIAYQLKQTDMLPDFTIEAG